MRTLTNATGYLTNTAQTDFEAPISRTDRLNRILQLAAAICLVIVSVKLLETPFPTLIAYPFAPERAVSLILERLEAANWTPVSEDFYEFDVCCDATARSAGIRTMLEDLIAPVALEGLLRPLGVSQTNDLQISVHRFAPEHTIGVHTDLDAHAVRLVINLNRDWSPEDGGVWILSTSSDLSENRRLIPPVNNSAFAFATGPNSFHALSQRQRGIGYAAVFSFGLTEAQV